VVMSRIFRFTPSMAPENTHTRGLLHQRLDAINVIRLRKAVADQDSQLEPCQTVAEHLTLHASITRFSPNPVQQRPFHPQLRCCGLSSKDQVIRVSQRALDRIISYSVANHKLIHPNSNDHVLTSPCTEDRSLQNINTLPDYIPAKCPQIMYVAWYHSYNGDCFQHLDRSTKAKIDAPSTLYLTQVSLVRSIFCQDG